ncbi:hypothetical protein EDC54_1024 [Samsonia erythrinae]|uniref:Uncharacterized protein n=1 Tax=Samsonia erythrinae TaxID=160434 RepID=A0A4R3VPP7_9GAMM|nr:hypothetical protein EDC54_1024 [Samsonia erythrinae]
MPYSTKMTPSDTAIIVLTSTAPYRLRKGKQNNTLTVATILSDNRLFLTFPLAT